MQFNLEGAREAGATDNQIIEFLKSKDTTFDYDKAISDGASVDQIVSFLGQQPSQPTQATEPVQATQTTPTEVTEAPQPSQTPQTPITQIASNSESGGGGYDTISTGKGDHGGKSYGKYQLASNTGTLASFVDKSQFKKELSKHKIGSKEFDAAWKQLASNQAFQSEQEDFSHAIVKPTLNVLAEYNINAETSPAITSLAFSTGNQYGNAGGPRVFKRVLSKMDDNFTEEDFINALTEYKVKSTDVWFKSSSKQVRDNQKKRFKREGQEALALIGSPQEQQDVEAPAVGDVEYDGEGLKGAANTGVERALNVPIEGGKIAAKISAENAEKRTEGNLKATKGLETIIKGFERMSERAKYDYFFYNMQDFHPVRVFFDVDRKKFAETMVKKSKEELQHEVDRKKNLKPLFQADEDKSKVYLKALSEPLEGDDAVTNLLNDLYKIDTRKRSDNKGLALLEDVVENVFPMATAWGLGPLGTAYIGTQVTSGEMDNLSEVSEEGDTLDKLIHSIPTIVLISLMEKTGIDKLGTKGYSKKLLAMGYEGFTEYAQANFSSANKASYKAKLDGKSVGEGVRMIGDQIWKDQAENLYEGLVGLGSAGGMQAVSGGVQASQKAKVKKMYVANATDPEAMSKAIDDFYNGDITSEEFHRISEANIDKRKLVGADLEESTTTEQEETETKAPDAEGEVDTNTADTILEKEGTSVESLAEQVSQEAEPEAMLEQFKEMYGEEVHAAVQSVVSQQVVEAPVDVEQKVEAPVEEAPVSPTAELDTKIENLGNALTDPENEGVFTAKERKSFETAKAKLEAERDFVSNGGDERMIPVNEKRAKFNLKPLTRTQFMAQEKAEVKAKEAVAPKVEAKPVEAKEAPKVEDTKLEGNIDYVPKGKGNVATNEAVVRDGVVYQMWTSPKTAEGKQALDNKFYPVGRLNEETGNVSWVKGAEATRLAKELGIIHLDNVKDGEIISVKELQKAKELKKDVSELTEADIDQGKVVKKAKEEFLAGLADKNLTEEQYTEALKTFKKDNNISAKEFGVVGKESSNADVVRTADGTVTANPNKDKGRTVRYDENRVETISAGEAGTDEVGVETGLVDDTADELTGATDEDQVEATVSEEEDLQVKREIVREEGIEEVKGVIRDMIKAKDRNAKALLSKKANAMLKRLAAKEQKLGSTKSTTELVNAYKDTLKASKKKAVAKVEKVVEKKEDTTVRKSTPAAKKLAMLDKQIAKTTDKAMLKQLKKAREDLAVNVTPRKDDSTKATVQEIAESLNLTFNGVQEGIGHIPDKNTFTVNEEGKESTFLMPTDATVEEIAKKRDEVIAKFKETPPKPTDFMNRRDYDGAKPFISLGDMLDNQGVDDKDFMKRANGFVAEVSENLGITTPLVIADGDMTAEQIIAHLGTLTIKEKADIHGLVGKISGASVLNINDRAIIIIGKTLKGKNINTAIAHELGHLVLIEKWNKLSVENRFEVASEFVEHMGKIGMDITVQELLEMNTGGAATIEMNNQSIKLSETQARVVAYELAFKEWFSDNVSAWMLTSKKPKSTVEKFFSGVAAKLRILFKGTKLNAPKLKAWLDALYETGGKDAYFQGKQMGTSVRDTKAMTKLFVEQAGFEVYKAELIANSLATAQKIADGEKANKSNILLTEDMVLDAERFAAPFLTPKAFKTFLNINALSKSFAFQENLAPGVTGAKSDMDVLLDELGFTDTFDMRINPKEGGTEVTSNGTESILSVNSDMKDPTAIQSVIQGAMDAMGISSMIGQDKMMTEKFDKLYDSLKDTPFLKDIEAFVKDAPAAQRKQLVMDNMISAAMDYALNKDGKKKDAFVALGKEHPAVQIYVATKQLMHRKLARFVNLADSDRDQIINNVLTTLPASYNPDMKMDAKEAPKKARKMPISSVTSMYVKGGMKEGKKALLRYMNERIQSPELRSQFSKDIFKISSESEFHNAVAQINGKVTKSRRIDLVGANRSLMKRLKQKKVRPDATMDFLGEKINPMKTMEANTKIIQNAESTIEEVTTATQMNKAIFGMASAATKIRVKGRNMEAKDAAKQVKEELTQTKRFMNKMKKEAGGHTPNKVLGIPRKITDGVHNKLRTVPSIIRRMYRGKDDTVVKQVMVDNFYEGANEEAKIRVKAQKAMDAIMADTNFTKKERIKLADSLQGDQVMRLFHKLTGKAPSKYKAEVTQTASGAKDQLTTINLTPGERMMVALMSKMELRRSQLLNGGVKLNAGDNSRFIFSKESLDAVINSLSTKEQKVVDGMNAWFNDEANVRQDLNKVSKQLFGMEMFNEDNYIPVMSEANFAEIKGNATNQMSSISEYFIKGSPTGQSFAKEITATENNAILLQDVFEAFAGHTEMAAKYIGYAVPMDTANKFLKALDPNGKAFEKLGWKGVDVKFRDMIQGVGGIINPGFGAKVSAYIRGGIAIKSLGFNPFVIAKQPVSLMLSWKYLSPTGVAATAIGKLPLGFGKKTFAKALEENPFLHSRYSNKAKLYYGETAKKANARQMVMKDKSISEVSMTGIALADKETLTRIWIGVNQTIKSKGLKGEEALKARQDLFRKIVYETQPDGNAFSKTGLMLTQNPILKEMMMFSTQRAKNGSMIIEASERMLWGAQDLTVGVAKGNAKMMKRGLKEMGESLWDLGLLGIFSAGILALIDRLRDKLYDDTEELDDMEEFTKKMIQVNTGNIIIAGHVLDRAVQAVDKNVLDGKYDYEVYSQELASVKEIENMGEVAKRLAEWKTYDRNEAERKEFNDKTRIKLVNALGVAMHMPTGTAIRLLTEFKPKTAEEERLETRKETKKAQQEIVRERRKEQKRSRNRRERRRSR